MPFKNLQFHRCMLVKRLTGYRSEMEHAGVILRTNSRFIVAGFFTREARRYMTRWNREFRPLPLPPENVCQFCGGDTDPMCPECDGSGPIYPAAFFLSYVEGRPCCDRFEKA